MATRSPPSTRALDDLVELPVDPGLWERVFTVAPLVLVGTKEGDGHDFAPKHMAMPLGWESFYCFVCAPRHATYRNLRAHGEFTVSFPGPDLIVATSLSASPRLEGNAKPALAAVSAVPARAVDVPVVAGCPFYLECALDRIVDGFGPNSLVVGRVVAASAAAGAMRAADVDDADLINAAGLLAYLAPGRFAAIHDSRSFPYPVDFRL